MLRSVEGSDINVQGTNDDAQISKLSCSKAGYFRDEFIQYFVKRASRRSPLINRGYYSRHAALRQLLNSFLATAARAAAGDRQPPQLLALGAGFDTTWFQLARDAGGRAPYRCLEVDFKEVTQRKAAIIAKEPQLHSLLRQPPDNAPQADGGQQQQQQSEQPAPSSDSGPGRPDGPRPEAGSAGAGAATHGVEIDPGKGQILSPMYCLVPVDLRDIDALDRAVQLAGWDRSAPTYVLSECVLVYMEPQHSTAVARWAAGAFPNAAMVIYEQIRPDDAFGRQMVSNLEMRGCPLKGLPATPTLEAHRARLTGAGWSWADARDMDELYRTFVDVADRARAERLELFDELEEWHMIQEHYCIAVGRNDAAGWLAGFGFGERPAEAARPMARLPLVD
ncbi:hypothetical protein GPECTOR_16g629 [Gonium pectorale]|uniref:Leucine carboxyl methyltransferase 1 homolog n=1 Tax=Gonium pectorale TaxID=33097 RepID=A0A150GL47_GONPE|nr:hypothetical protein GPECTOR_16g629 [Gonium pectorale]|eukprot:KXZ50455.1 hypothetical protein GPECTOR_16g629 [Gonium pectorale]